MDVLHRLHLFYREVNKFTILPDIVPQEHQKNNSQSILFLDLKDF